MGIGGFNDAFISYGRADSKDFATKLYQRLTEQGFGVWFDQNDIPLGVDFQAQIDDGIEKANNFLFLIAPHSINSPYCGKEIDLALKRNKRIIPLLHVEQISRETWQKRKPNGTDEEWAQYQAKGLHSSFPNMHPEIGKINWVYFREGVDDFEKSFSGLISIFQRHRDYVRQHTYLLAQALDWERQQKQTSLLLSGEDRKPSEEWLKVRFKDEQPPCLPTDLHCEFITESTKYANNRMTHAFLCHAEEDGEMTETVRRRLMRQGFTVWTNKTDIQTGVEFQEAINRGIAEADNLVYLMSAASLHSQYCQQEISYALSLNKRIIPLLLEAIAPDDIPANLRSLQYIDLSTPAPANDPDKPWHQLLRILKQDAVYYEQHKLLLAKAMQWQAEERQPSLLLRGYNLRQWEAWLKLAKQHSQHLPLPLQEEYINQSLDKTATAELDVFISYTRADADFAAKLGNALQVQGKTIWFDQESIPTDADYQQELFQGLEAADTFLLVVSPSSLRSPDCLAEVEHAQKMSKRLVLVVYRPIAASDLPETLASLLLIDFNQKGGEFAANLTELINTLDTDREHLHVHTRLLIKAMEWERKDQEEHALLRGGDLVEAEQWLATAAGKTPSPAEVQQAYILASRQAETARQEAEIKRQQAEIKKQKLWLTAVSFISVIAAVAAVVAVGMYGKAEENRKQAEVNEKQAERNQFKSRIEEAASLFSARNELGAMTAITQVVQQVKAKSWLDEEVRMMAGNVLREILYGIAEENRLEGHGGLVMGVQFSPDGKLLASASADGTIRIWTREGRLLQILRGHSGKVLSLAFSPDGKSIASASSDYTVRLWKVDGRFPLIFSGHREIVRSVSFSPDGLTIASASDDHTVRLWSTDGKLLKTFIGHEAGVRAVQFSPNGQMLATTSSDKTARIWSINGELLATLGGADNPDGHTAGVNEVAFSPNGQLVATASSDNSIKLWRKDGLLLKTLWGHANDVYSVTFSRDGRSLASGSADNTILLWNLKGQIIKTFRGHNDSVQGLHFSPDSKTLASASNDRSIRLWNLDSSWTKTLEQLPDSTWTVNFSPDGMRLAAGASDGSTVLWHGNGTLINLSKEHNDRVNWVNFDKDRNMLSLSDDGVLVSWDERNNPIKHQRITENEVVRADISPDRTLLGLALANGTVELRRLDGQLQKKLQDPYGAAIRSIGFSPDSQMLAAGDNEGAITLWKQDGTVVKQFPDGHKGVIRSLSFSRDGRWILTAGDDREIRLWTLDGKLVKIFKGHQQGVRDASFSPDNHLIVSGGDDRAVIVWSVASGQPIKVLRGHEAAVNRVRFRVDGLVIASGAGDNTVKVWKLDAKQAQLGSDLDTLIQQSCTWLQPYLQYNQSLRRQLEDGQGKAPQCEPLIAQKQNERPQVQARL